jgi:hypothetical protein
MSKQHREVFDAFNFPPPRVKTAPATFPAPLVIFMTNTTAA